MYCIYSPNEQLYRVTSFSCCQPSSPKKIPSLFTPGRGIIVHLHHMRMIEDPILRHSRMTEDQLFQTKIHRKLVPFFDEVLRSLVTEDCAIFLKTVKLDRGIKIVVYRRSTLARRELKGPARGGREKCDGATATGAAGTRTMGRVECNRSRATSIVQSQLRTSMQVAG